MIRQIFNLIPKGVQERIKLLFYNSTIRDFTFSKEKGIYRTKSREGWSILTGSPLYFIVKDVNRYEKFYTVSNGDIVIDAGANEGILSLVFSQKSKGTGKVYAFEPDEKNIYSFKANVARNSRVENIKLHTKGLWKEKGNISFFEAGTVGSSVFYEGKDAIKKDIEVISLDEFIKEQKLEKLDFVKMDIEGAELEVLKGATETIKSLRPNFAIASYHIIENDYTYKKLEAFFLGIKYPFKTVFFGDGEIMTYAGPAVLKASDGK